MEDTLIKFDEMISELTNLVSKFRSALGDKPAPKAVRDGLNNFNRQTTKYLQTSETDNIETIAEAVKMLAVYGQSIGQAIPTFLNADENIKLHGSELLAKANEIRSFAEQSPITYKPINLSDTTSNPQTTFSYARLKRDFKAIIEEQEKQDQRLKKTLNETDLRVTSLEERLNELESSADLTLKKISNSYDQALSEAADKAKQINDILGHVSGRTIAGDFENSAAGEKAEADWLRFGSLACMFLIAVLLGYSFWETTKVDFDWQKSIFRIALTFLLSVPAAYLARESSKHRQQQYQHLQTSLDLKALAPFTASLPLDEQHRLKTDIAARIFSAKDFSKVGADPYPLNTHELLMEFIKKIEIKTSDTKSKNEDSSVAEKH